MQAAGYLSPKIGVPVCASHRGPYHAAKMVWIKQQLIPRLPSELQSSANRTDKLVCAPVAAYAPDTPPIRPSNP
eukprot:1371172-Rhodomonas_salina.2